MCTVFAENRPALLIRELLFIHLLSGGGLLTYSPRTMRSTRLAQLLRGMFSTKP